jgi:peptidoglycan/LPS O-acetylase OafA/YrhL
MEMELVPGKNRSIPSLDGLRAFSVLAVILGHVESPWFDRVPFSKSFGNGGQGVSVFFVISGFLITHLLLKELNRDGRISLKKFYLRRTFRIFPPFYAYLLVVAILGLGLHKVFVTPVSLAVAATYSWNYFWAFVKGPSIWVLGHCWSLAVEEQFYLLWPLCMAFFRKMTNLKIAVAVVVLSPLSRIATYFLFPSARGQVPIMLHTRLDSIMFGCMLSLMLDLKIGQRFTRLAIYRITPVLSLLFLFFVDTPAEQHFRGNYSMTIGISASNIAIAALLLNVIFRHEAPLGKLLNWRPVRHLGMISYSLYLWQQLFTGPVTSHFPLTFLPIVVCAELSFWLVEKPSFRVRDTLQRWLISRRAMRSVAAVS